MDSETRAEPGGPAHPDPERLRELARGELDEGTLVAVGEHLDACPSCRATLEAISRADPLQSRLRGTGTGGGVVVDELHRRLATRAIVERRGERRPFGPETPGSSGRAADLLVEGGTVGDYELLGEVGRGGMGVVFRARHLRSGLVVALKMILAGRFATEVDWRRFRLETDYAARLDHPHIVQVLEVGVHEGRPFLVLDWAEGGTLGDRLDDVPWPPTEAARLVEALAGAVEELHRQGIIHRDLKPDNVLLAAERRGPDPTRPDPASVGGRLSGYVPKLTDFGLAAAITGRDGLTRTGVVLGTPEYMAPEQAGGRPAAIGPPADVYALGVILFRLATGSLPFRGERPIAVLRALTTEPPTPPRRLVPEIPRALETVILRALEKNPARRYRSAGDLAEDLRRFQEGRPILARRAGPARRAWRWGRRNRVVAGLAAAAALAGSISLGLAAWTWREASEQAARAAGAEGEKALRREQADRARREARRLAAEQTLDRGLGLLGRGDSPAGRHWLAQALLSDELSPASRRLARLNLAAWRDAAPAPARVIAGPEPIASMVHDPDGRTIHALDKAGTVLRHFSLATGEESGPSSRLPEVRDDRVDYRQFSRDGRSILVVHSGGRSIQAFHAATGRAVGEPRTLGDPPSWGRFVIAVDASAFAVAGPDGSIEVIGAATGRPLGPPIRAGSPAPRRLEIAPGGRTVVALGADGGRIWDVATGLLARRAPGMSPETVRIVFGHRGRPITVERDAGHKDGPDDGWLLRFWDDSGSPLGEPFRFNGQVPGGDLTALGPDGATLAVADYHGWLSLFDARLGARRAEPEFLGSLVKLIAFSPDGATIAAGTREGEVRLVDARTGRPIGEGLPQSWPVAGLGFHADGRQLDVLGLDGSIFVWRLPPGLPVGVSTPEGPANPPWLAAFDRGGRRALIFDPVAGQSQVVAATGRVLGPRMPARWRALPLLLGSPDGRRWATSAHDFSTMGVDTRLWDPEGRPIGPPLPSRNWIVGLAFSPDGRTLAATGYGGWVRFFDAESGAPTGTPIYLQRIGTSLAYSPDGKILAVGTGPSSPPRLSFQLRLHDVASGRLLRSVDLPQWTIALEFSPDGRSLLARSSRSLNRTNYGEFRIWDVDRLQPTGEPLSSPASREASPAFLPAGRLLTGGPGGIWEWDLASGRPSRLVIPSKVVHGLAVDPAARWLATVTEDGVGHLHDLATGRPVGPPLRAGRRLIGLRFDEEGRSVVAAVEGFAVRTWPLPEPGPVGADDPSAIARATGTLFDPATGSVATITGAEWRRLGRNPAPGAGAGSAADGDADAGRRHEIAADNAEASGNAFSSLWHLDRLARSRPDDWTIPARRSRALASLGRLDIAAEELARARRLAPEGSLRSWQLDRAIDTRLASDLPLARWYVDRLLSEDPDDRDALSERAELHEADGRADLGDLDAIRASALGLDLSIVEKHADRIARAGRWGRAAELLAAADRHAPGLTDSLAQRRAIASLLAGDRDGYRDACRRLLERARGPAAVASPEDLAYACALGPGAVEDYTWPIALAEGDAKAAARTHYQEHAALSALGAVLARAGKTTEAIETIDRGAALVGGPSGQDWAFLALAREALGDVHEARRCFRQLESTETPKDFWESAKLQLLRSELGARLANKPLPTP